MANPLLGRFKTPYETIPFNKIKNEHFIPAFEESCKKLNEEIVAITTNPEPPTFSNTIIAIERSGFLLKRVSGVFFGLLDVENSEEFVEIAQSVLPQIAACRHNTYLNNTLFDRVKTIYNKRMILNLSTEDSRLLQKTYNTFFNEGVNLSDEDKEKYRKLSAELGLLELKFNQNILKEENSFVIHITDLKDASGIPVSALQLAATEAQGKDKGGWMFTLSENSYNTFMKYSNNRPLREKMYMAKINIGNNNNEFDNKNIIKQIANIRLEIANMMGYKNYAEFVIKDRMAKNENNVMKLMQQLIGNYKSLAVNEYNTIRGYISGIEEESDFELMYWDWPYYSEKLKNQYYKINDELLRPYFELERVSQGIFNLATQLYGLTFKENKKITVYNPDIKVFEVLDAKGNFKAVLYTDFLQRLSKSSGAWMTTLQEQYIDDDDKNIRPQISIVMNFPRPGPTTPSLLTYSEVQTLIHEFGHALHGILSECKYASLSGTNVDQDFVELPSQIMENWVKEKAFLDQFAVHYSTDEKIPSDIMDKLIEANNFNIGNQCCRQVSLSLLDMAWHSITTPFDGDIEKFEKQVCEIARILPDIQGTMLSTSFGHIFSDEVYAACYYGYKWAEVLEADAFDAFKEHGVFSKAVADSFKDYILSRGDTDDPNNLYIRFRCKQPNINALLRRNGLAAETFSVQQ
jgi:peptidyl-dipeptidase Dcp